MINENMNPNIPQHYNPNSAESKLATLLVVVVSFQQKIEILKCKLCGHHSFSPALYYQLLDKTEKSYIDMEDMITYIKRSRPNFNIDARYLKAMFKKFNQDDNTSTDKLTYFGYLNMIKPYFDTKAACDLLLRDSVVTGNQYNEAVKKTLDQLICTTYACAAEHQKVKQLIIMGDIDQGGSDEGQLYNVGQIMSIIGVENNRLSQYSKMGNGILHTFYEFICKNSEYEVDRDDMRYLLAYLMCHQYQINGEKSLNLLFMPVALTFPIRNKNVRDVKCRTSRTNNQYHQKQSLPTYDEYQSTQIQRVDRMNFLHYVHPNSAPKAVSNRQPPPNQIQYETHISPRHHSPRNNFLNVSSHQQHVKTPFLQKFLKQSKVLKNMSRYRADQSMGASSAFVQDHHSARPKYGQTLQVPVGVQHVQKPINKDFNLEDILMSNSRVQNSEYFTKGKVIPMASIRQKNAEQEQDGILGNFMFK